jgi:hypothetical protein
VGRPAKDRRAIARAIVAKAVYNMSTTRQLLDRLSSDNSLRRICGWQGRCEIPHESQFSRVFAEFAASELPQRLHKALIEATQKDRLIGHISRDSTEIEGREKPLRAPERRVWRPFCTGARQRQSDVPSYVRNRRAGRRSDTSADHVGSKSIGTQ